jgi:hypothetical protein
MSPRWEARPLRSSMDFHQARWMTGSKSDDSSLLSAPAAVASSAARNHSGWARLCGEFIGCSHTHVGAPDQPSPSRFPSNSGSRATFTAIRRASLTVSPRVRCPASKSRRALVRWRRGRHSRSVSCRRVTAAESDGLSPSAQPCPHHGGAVRVLDLARSTALASPSAAPSPVVIQVAAVLASER